MAPRSGAGVLELVVSNRTLLVVLRVAMLAVAGYLVYSVSALINARRPIVKLGPADTQRVGQEASNATAVGEAALERIRELETALEDANARGDALISYIDYLRQDAEDDDDGATQAE